MSGGMTLLGFLRRVLHRPPVTTEVGGTCLECGRLVPPGLGFRTADGVFCTEDHAAVDQAWRVGW